MSKPYTKEMWDQEKKEALKEYLVSSREQDKRTRRKIILTFVITIFSIIFLYYFQDIVYEINHHGEKLTKSDEIALVEETVTNLVRDKKVRDNATLFMADLYSGKYGVSISTLYSHTKYPYECLGYISVENGVINTQHYCEMYE